VELIRISALAIAEAFRKMILAWNSSVSPDSASMTVTPGARPG
jgi:hypothetical protein